MPLRQLPTRARLEEYQQQAQELVEGFKLGDPESIGRIRINHPHFRGMPDAEIRSGAFTLSDAQLIVASWNSFESWIELAHYVEAVSQESSSVLRFELA